MNNRSPSPRIGEGSICIGEIKGAHGVKGLVRLYVFAQDTSLFKTLKNPTITLKNKHKNEVWLAEVEGISSKEAADAIKGTKVFCERDDLAKPAADEVYHADLVGLVCVDEDKNEIGTVINVHNFGAGDLLDIKPVKGGESFYLGFTKENVLSIDDKITVRIPEIL